MPLLRKSFLAVNDIKGRAEFVMKVKHEVTVKIRKQEKEYRRKKKMEAEQVDLKMLQIDKEILKNQIKQNEELLEGIESREKQEKQNLAATP